MSRSSKSCETESAPGKSLYLDGQPIRAISFDAGETLVRPYPSFSGAMRRMLLRQGIRLKKAQEQAFVDLFERYDQEYREAHAPYSFSDETSRAYWTGLYHRFVRSLDHSPEIDAERALTIASTLYSGFTATETYRPFADARPTLRAARSKGLIVGICSNWESWLGRMLSDLRFDSHLDFTVISGVAGCEKPDPRIFEKVIEATGLPPAEILHIGDSLRSDYLGAQAAGLTPLLLDRAGVFDESKYRSVGSLRELFAPDGPLRTGPEAISR